MTFAQKASAAPGQSHRPRSRSRGPLAFLLVRSPGCLADKGGVSPTERAKTITFDASEPAFQDRQPTGVRAIERV